MIHHHRTRYRYLAYTEYLHAHIFCMDPAKYLQALQPILALPRNPSQIVPVGLSSPEFLEPGWRAFQIAMMSWTAWYHYQAQSWIGSRDEGTSDHHASEGLVRFQVGGVFDWVDVVLRLSLWPIRWLLVHFVGSQLLTSEVQVLASRCCADSSHITRRNAVIKPITIGSGRRYRSTSSLAFRD